MALWGLLPGFSGSLALFVQKSFSKTVFCLFFLNFSFSFCSVSLDFFKFF